MVDDVGLEVQGYSGKAATVSDFSNNCFTEQ